MEFKELKPKVAKEILGCQTLKELDKVFRRYLGKKGEITLILRSIKNLPEGERRKVGGQANEIKKFLQDAFLKKRKELLAKTGIASRVRLDVTAPGRKPEIGHLHPLTLVRKQAQEIFQQMGFSVVLGPEVETEWYNFDALNIPAEHPARDMWNTLWLRSNQQILNPKSEILNKPKTQNPKPKKLLLRTHTSPVQIRYMEGHNPPFRIIVPGRVFRHEATDASHEINFYQAEGLMVDKDVSVVNFKAIIQEFFNRFFVSPPRDLPGAGRAEPIKIRLRPSYFPFVEPGFEVDMSCTACTSEKRKAQNSKHNCSVCQGAGWLEMMGAGMVHPAVFEAVKLNPQHWRGFAFGMGLDRLAMMKYKINDIRLFYSGDLRFLQQF